MKWIFGLIPITLLGFALLTEFADGSGELAAAETPANLDNLPYLIRDDSSKDWVVDNFAGNSTAGIVFYQGPAAEVGGLGGSSVTARPDGSVYINGNREVSPDGILRVIPSEDGWGQGMFWDDKEQAKYILGNNCIRRAVKVDGKWQSKVLAGTPGKAGQPWKNDGPGKTALIGSDLRGSHRTAAGVIYWMEGGNAAIRKFDKGLVTTLGFKFIDAPDNFQLAMQGRMGPGEDDDSLLVADGWNWVARRVNLKTLQVTNLAFMPNTRDQAKAQYAASIQKRFGTPIRWERANRASNGAPVDGPALTHASCNSGIADVVYDPFYKAIWLEGPDATCLRWLKDGWVKTVVGAARNGESWNFNGKGTPGEKAEMCWSHVCGVDGKGMVYFYAHSKPTNIWRTYNKKEVKP